MEEKLRIERLIRESQLAKALGTSAQTLSKLRSEGLPWMSIGGKVFYHETEFMEWLLKNKKRRTDREEEKEV